MSGLEVYSSPALGPDGSVVVGSKDYNVYCLNSDGSLRWSNHAGNYVNSSPAIAADGSVIVGSNDNILSLVRVANSSGKFHIFDTAKELYLWMAE